MKNAATTSIRAFQSVRAKQAVARTFSSSACSRDASAEAESSSRPSVSKYTVQPGEDSQTAWARNMDEVREWRRRHAETSAQVPLYIPKSAGKGFPVKKPKTPTEASLSSLLASGAALGHNSSLLAPSYVPYVYGNRSGLSIIDLEQTLPMLRRASAFVRDVVKEDGVVLLLGTRAVHKKPLMQAKDRLEDNGFLVNDWVAGTITNAETFHGLEPLLDKTYLPDIAIVLNPSENFGAIREFTARNVPTIGIVDSDTDPRIVTYAIPANMESVRTVELILGALSIAGQEGRRLRLRDDAKRSERAARDAEWKKARGNPN